MGSESVVKGRFIYKTQDTRHARNLTYFKQDEEILG